MAALSQTDILQGLQWLRSTDPALRAQGIDLLCGNVHEDPRIVTVFEQLYESDPDLHVRQLAWQALVTGAEPSVPAPGPVSAPPKLPKPPAIRPLDIPTAAQVRVAVPTFAPATPPATQPDTPRRMRSPQKRRLFLLDPASKSIIARQRRSARRWLSGAGLFALAIVVALLALALGADSLPGVIDQFRLSNAGITVEGTITALENDGRAYRAAYRFDTTHGVRNRSRSGVYAVTQDAYNLMHTGDTVRVTYWPDDPAVSRIETDDPASPWRERELATAIALGVVALLAAALGSEFHRAARRWRVIKGWVVTSKGRTVDGTYRVLVQYRFKSPQSGELLDGKASRAREDLNDETLPGPDTPVAIYFRSDHQHRLL